MIIRETWPGRIAACRRMLEVTIGRKSEIVVKLPLIGYADVWGYDGNAWIFPLYRQGIIRMDWFSFMRYARKNNGNR